MGDDRPSVYLEPPNTIYRASSLGSCTASLVRARLGQTPSPPPAFMQVKYDEGNTAEPIMLRALAEQMGFRLLDGLQLEQYGQVTGNGQVETEMKVGGNRIRCHPDGVAQCFSRKLGCEWEVGDRVVVEVKAFGDVFYKKYLKEGVIGFPFYSWQLAIEMHSTGLPCMYGVGVKDGDGKVDPENILWKYVGVEEAPWSKVQIMQRVLTVEKLAREIEGGERGIDGVPCDIAMFPCGFWQDHDLTTPGGVWYKGAKGTDGADVEQAMIDTMVRQWDTWGQVEIIADKKMEQARKFFIQYDVDVAARLVELEEQLGRVHVHPPGLHYESLGADGKCISCVGETRRLNERSKDV